MKKTIKLGHFKECPMVTVELRRSRTSLTRWDAFVSAPKGATIRPAPLWRGIPGSLPLSDVVEHLTEMHKVKFNLVGGVEWTFKPEGQS